MWHNKTTKDDAYAFHSIWFQVYVLLKRSYPHSYPSLMEISDYESKSMDNRH